MAHRFSHDVFSLQGVFIHTSCENCGAIANTAEAQAACPHSLQSSEFPAVPAKNYLFVNDISSLERIESSESACKNPIGLDQVIEESLEIINENIHRESALSGQYRKPILLYSRLARGGKTTTLLALFDKIRHELKINCMSISFNGSSQYERLHGESESEALYRIIVMQLIDYEKYNGGRIVPEVSDWERLDEYIGTDRFVLLIDEMNALCFPIRSEVARILKTYFLDKSNRYLVISSHMPMDLEDEVFRDSVISKRPTKVVELPICSDLMKLQEMGPHCHNLNEKIVNYYGQIPSLLYAERECSDNSPVDRFRKYNWRTPSHDSGEFYDFVEELINGWKLYPSVRIYDKLSSSIGENRGRWPPCYIHCIIELFLKNNFPGVTALISAFKSLNTYQEAVDIGKWWEEVIAIVLILRCCAASGRGMSGPFEITGGGEALGSLVSLFKFGNHIETLEQANEVMKKQELLNRSLNHSSFTIFIPSFASFPQFDGFVVFTKIGMKSKKIGFQCKHGVIKGSDGERPTWLVDRAILLRGKAYDSSRPIRGWEYWTKEQVKELLGVSFEILYPGDENF